MSFLEKSSIVEHGARLSNEITPPPSQSIDAEWTYAEEKRVRNRIDWHIVPIVTLLYLLCFLDRANVGNARIQGMQEELDLRGYRFNWALTVFYIPYLVVEVPSNILLKHFGAKIWIPFLVFGFGFCSLICSFVQTHTQLYIARAFLGVFEGGTLPGIAFFLSGFYRRQELMFRVGIFIAGSSMSGAFGGLLATGLARISRWGTAATPIHEWRNIFFFEGLVTMVTAIICYFYMTTSPGECTFLSDRERYIAFERVRREHREGEREKTQLRHIRRGMLNVNNIICASGFFLTNISVQSLSLFMPTILKALGWTATKAQLLSVPPYVLASIWSISCCWASDRLGRRGVFGVMNGLISMIGYAVLMTSDRPGIKYMAVFFAAAGCFPLGPIMLSWGINNAAGPTIRAVSSAYIVSLGTLGAIVATWTYIPSDAPKYRKGHGINVGAQAAAATVCVLGILYIKWENRKRVGGGRDHRIQGLTTEEAQKLGYRNPEFRYVE